MNAVDPISIPVIDLHSQGVTLQLQPPQQQAPLQTPPAHTWNRVDGSPWMQRYDGEDGSLLRLPGLADFHINATGTVVRAWPVPELDAEACRQLHLNNVLPMALSRQGKLVLHASAVLMEGEAVVFVGVSGRGKSTLATYLASQGHALIVDDGLQIEAADGCFMAMPGDRDVRLWRDSQEQLLPDPPAAAIRPLGHTDKHRIHADAALPVTTFPQPIRAVFLLGEDAGTEVAIRKLGPVPAMMELIHYSFLLDIGHPRRHAEQMRMTAALASAAEILVLDYPRDYACLPQVHRALLAHTRA